MGTAATKGCCRCCYNASVLKSLLIITARRDVWILQTALASLRPCVFAPLRQAVCSLFDRSVLEEGGKCREALATPARGKTGTRLPRDFGDTGPGPMSEPGYGGVTRSSSTAPSRLWLPSEMKRWPSVTESANVMRRSSRATSPAIRLRSMDRMSIDSAL